MSGSSNSYHFPILGALLAAGLIISSLIVGNKLDNTPPNAGITVQGQAEAEHKATLGTWRVGVNIVAASYPAATEQNKAEIIELTKFLITQGIKPENLELKPIYVEENIESYIDDLGKERSRKNGFKARRDIYVSTTDLDTLSKTFANIQDLKAKNMAISFDSPNYYLENVEEIKRGLIAQATKDAQARATEFANTSNVKVGTLKAASQQDFSIRPAKPGAHAQTSDDTSAIEKKVRLVISAQYAID